MRTEIELVLRGRGHRWIRTFGARVALGLVWPFATECACATTVVDVGVEPAVISSNGTYEILGTTVVNQIEVHPYFQQKELQSLHAKHHILTQAWSPIGGITSYRGGGKSTFDDPTLQQIAREHGKSPAQVMLRWHLQQGRSAIPKSTRAARIAENFDVFGFELTEQQLAAIDALDTGVRGGPEPDDITLENYGRDIPEA